MSWRDFHTDILPPQKNDIDGGCSSIFYIGLFSLLVLGFLYIQSTGWHPRITNTVFALITIACIVRVLAPVFTRSNPSEVMGKISIIGDTIIVTWHDKSTGDFQLSITEIKRLTVYHPSPRAQPNKRTLTIVSSKGIQNFETELDLQQTENLGRILKGWKERGYNVLL